MDLSILKFSIIKLSSFSYFSFQCINIGSSFLIPIFLQYVLGGSPFAAGIVMLPGALLGAFISPIAGKWADEKGFARPVIIGNICLTIGTFLFLIFIHQLNFIVILCFFAFLRLGFNLSFSNTISNAATNVPAKNSPDVNSFYNMIQLYAGSVGVGILAALVANFQKFGQGSMTLRSLNGSQAGFGFVSVLAVLALLATLLNYHIQANQKKD